MLSVSLGFFVPGRPIPQGSKRHVGGGLMIEASKHLPAWREAVTLAARCAKARARVGTIDGPVAVRLEFYLPEPKRPRHRLPITRPDADKLTRACLDALTNAGIWGDDAQVVHIDATKQYGQAGVYITVRSIE